MFYKAPNQYITEGNAFEINGTQYPANWLNLSTPEEKEALGLEEVTDANAPLDDRFYWVSSTLNGAVRTYTNTPKDLDGLKTQWALSINAAAYSMLLSTDYIDIRNLRDSTYKPEWIIWRDSVRTAAKNAVTAINAAADIPALQTAIQVAWPHDPNYINN